MRINEYIWIPIITYDHIKSFIPTIDDVLTRTTLEEFVYIMPNEEEINMAYNISDNLDLNQTQKQLKHLDIKEYIKDDLFNYKNPV
uniref:Group-specific protein n=1 Tax=Strongyloides stercoralis TaxID=6248 RepID=A0A0K0ETN5_STRER